MGRHFFFMAAGGLFKGFEKADLTAGSAMNGKKQKVLIEELVNLYPELADGNVFNVMGSKDNWKLQKAIIKKGDLSVTFLISDNVPKFWQTKTDEKQNLWYPTLTLVHEFPYFIKSFRADKGAVRHLISGADVMAPGLTNANAEICDVP